jgi:hypothetical protein
LGSAASRSGASSMVMVPFAVDRSPGLGSACWSSAPARLSGQVSIGKPADPAEGGHP